MADLQKLVDELSKLTVVEAAELSKKLEEPGRFRRSSGRGRCAPAAAAAPAAEQESFRSSCSRRARRRST